MAPKGVSNRTLLAKQKGIKMGSYMMVTYREDGKGLPIKYEGTLCDRRIGGTDRESNIQLKNCLKIGHKNEILGQEGSRKFIDAFIDDMDLAPPRTLEELAAAEAASKAAAEAEAAAAAAAAQMHPGNMGMGMGCGGCGCGGCGPMGMGCGAMGMGGMGGMGCMPMMNPMMGMMGMGMPMMNPMMGMMMNPMMGMMGAMATMGAMAGMSKNDDDDEDERPKKKKSQDSSRGSQIPPPVPEHLLLPGLKTVQEESQDVEKELENIDEGAYISVKYTHPQLGKTTYEGTLQEKFVGGSQHQSYIQLSNSLRIGSSGDIKEKEALKRLMVAFVDEVRLTEPKADRKMEERSRSRSRGRSNSRDRR